MCRHCPGSAGALGTELGGDHGPQCRPRQRTLRKALGLFIPQLQPFPSARAASRIARVSISPSHSAVLTLLLPLQFG